MDPLSMAMMGLTSQGADAAGVPAAMASQSQGLNPDMLDPILGAIKGQASQKPIMSGGVSGVGLPFLQQMPNILSPALTQAYGRIGGPPSVPSLGSLIAGGR